MVVHWRGLCSMCGLYPPDAMDNVHLPQSWQTKMSPDVAKCSLGGKTAHIWENWTKPQRGYRNDPDSLANATKNFFQEMQVRWWKFLFPTLNSSFILCLKWDSEHREDPISSYWRVHVGATQETITAFWSKLKIHEHCHPGESKLSNMSKNMDISAIAPGEMIFN